MPTSCAGIDYGDNALVIPLSLPTLVNNYCDVSNNFITWWIESPLTVLESKYIYISIDQSNSELIFQTLANLDSSNVSEAKYGLVSITVYGMLPVSG